MCDHFLVYVIPDEAYPNVVPHICCSNCGAVVNLSLMTMSDFVAKVVENNKENKL
jgi:hypothetical protein